MGDKTESWPMPISILKKDEEKLFQRYWVF